MKHRLRFILWAAVALTALGCSDESNDGDSYNSTDDGYDYRPADPQDSSGADTASPGATAPDFATEDIASEPDSATHADPDTGEDPDIGGDTEPERNTDTGVDSAADSETGPIADTEADTETGASSDTGSPAATDSATAVDSATEDPATDAPVVDPACEGIISIEAESVQMKGDWKIRSDSKASGGAYIYFDGPNYYSSPKDAHTMTYRFHVPKAGNYTVKWYMRQPPGEQGTDKSNDAWIYIADNRGYAKNTALTDFHKFVGRSDNNFALNGNVDMHGSQSWLTAKFPSPGEYSLQISGRSEQLQIDRFILFTGMSIDEAKSRTANGRCSSSNGDSGENRDTGADSDAPPGGLHPWKGAWGFDGNRIAVSADGNNQPDTGPYIKFKKADQDDWAATAATLAMIAKAGLCNNLVHYSYNNFIGSPPHTTETNEMEVSVNGQIKNFHFDRRIFFDVTVDQDAAISHLATELAKSTAANPLYFLHMGPAEFFYRAVKKVVDQGRAEALRHVYVITHSEYNNTHLRRANHHTIFEAVSLSGGQLHLKQIKDQNSKNNPNQGFCSQQNFAPWQWMKNHSDPGVRFIYQRMKDSPKGADISDAGMLYYLLKDDENGNPSKLKAFFGSSVPACQ